MAWGKAGSTTLSASGDVVTATVSNNNFYTALSHNFATGGNTGTEWKLNSTTSGYAQRRSPNYGSDTTLANQSWLIQPSGWNTDDKFNVVYICNISGQEKLAICNVITNNGNGATIPDSDEIVAKSTVNTSDDITSISNNNATSGSYTSDSNLSVLGSDLTTSAGRPTNVQVGSRFEETDTRKMYHYGGGGGSITKDNQDIVQRGSATPSSGQGGTGLVSGTFSNFAVGNNSNRVLIIASGCYNAAPNITGVTFNGSENFEKITQYKPASGFNHEFWILYNPTVTTADVVITYGTASGFEAGAGQTGAICYSFYNVKQSDAFGTPVEKNSGASATPFIAITPTTAGSMIIDCYFSGAGSPVPNNDETDGMNIICGGVDRSMASQYDLNPTIGSVNNMSRTSGNSSYSQIAVEIKVAVDEWKELGT